MRRAADVVVVVSDGSQQGSFTMQVVARCLQMFCSALISASLRLTRGPTISFGNGFVGRYCRGLACESCVEAGSQCLGLWHVRQREMFTALFALQM